MSRFKSFDRRRRAVFRIERHKLGPRVHVFGRRIHEYQVGFALLTGSTVSFAESGHVLVSAVVAALAGLWLVVKDWPDLFPATRDQASWRLGVHRLPRGSDDPVRTSETSLRRRPRPFAGRGQTRPPSSGNPAAVQSRLPSA